jgi:dihydrofolate reductase
MGNVRNKPISIIVAIAENYAIGKDNQLLWKISDDLKRFKSLTTGHQIVMGRKTFLSLPKGALPDRTNIVISDIPGETFESCTMVNSIEDAIAICDEREESFIIGGGMVYKQFLPHAEKLYLTRIHKSFDGDTFFPAINFDEWDEISREECPQSEKNEFAHSYIVYRRK